MEKQLLKNIVEAALFAAGEPLSLDRLMALFDEGEQPARDLLREVLADLAADCEGRGIELKEVGSGFRYQVRQEVSAPIGRLWDERPARYSRALLETLALIAYRQPITRAEIEDIRGVTVSTNIMKTLQEREWVRVVGHRDVPGRPAMYATTRQFLDHFNLKSLGELPTLAELRDLDKINRELDLREPGVMEAEGADPAEELVGVEESAGGTDISEQEGEPVTADVPEAATDEPEPDVEPKAEEPPEEPERDGKIIDFPRQ